MEWVRPAAVAGSFYPAEPQALAATVARFLAEADAAAAVPPKVVIAPHAGYVYSGPVAARAYARLRSLRGRVARTVVIGPAHHHRVTGLAVSSASAFETPLGRISLATEAIKELAELPQVEVADLPHAPEHAIEVQLPFLQVVLEDFCLVPLLVGGATPEAVREVLDRLWDGPETVIIVSSDLSHYQSYAAASARDSRTAEAIEALAVEALGPEEACGHLAIRGLLALAAQRELTVERLDLRNSGDTAGPRDHVVGYGAWAFLE